MGNPFRDPPASRVLHRGSPRGPGLRLPVRWLALGLVVFQLLARVLWAGLTPAHAYPEARPGEELLWPADPGAGAGHDHSPHDVHCECADMICTTARLPGPYGPTGLVRSPGAAEAPSPDREGPPHIPIAS